jgi:hypothetical protein
VLNQADVLVIYRRLNVHTLDAGTVCILYPAVNAFIRVGAPDKADRAESDQGKQVFHQ